MHKKQPRRVYNYFKRYNEELYEHLVVNLVRNLSDINLKGVFLVLAHGNMAHLKRRSNVRLMRQFAVKGVETLAAEKEAVDTAPEAFDNLCAKYYEYSVRYCLNSQDRQELNKKFKEALDIDIEALLERVSPLGFKLAFDLPKASTEVEEALEADQDADDKEGTEDFKAFETSRKRNKA